MSDSRTQARAPLAVALMLATTLTGAGLTVGGQASATVDLCHASSSDLDLNGDGYDDAVVGDPFAMVAGKKEAGAVIVLYGDADWRVGEGRRTVLTQASVPGSNVEAGDHFGWSVAVDDASGDGCADLLVGSPGEDWDGDADAGIAHMVSFTPDGRGGPGAARATVLDQAGLGGTVEPGDQFGYAVAIGDGGDGSDDSTGAIGAPGEDLADATDAGVVHSFSYFEDSARTGGQDAQGSGLPGIPEDGDRFGASVLVAPLWVTDGTDVGIEPSIVAGAPGDTVQREDATAVDGAGSVTTWDLVTGFEQQVTQESAGVPGSAEAGDAFGFSLAFSETSTTASARYLAIGSPGEDIGRVSDAGSVTMFADVPTTGLRGGAALSQSTARFAGRAEPRDRFGYAVALRPRNSGVTLVVGVPYEDIGSAADAGMAQTADVFSESSVAAARSYTENSAGTPGAVARGSRFGLAVAAMEGVAESVAAIASPYQAAGSVFVVDSSGVTRAWVPGRGGVPTLTAGRFGWSLAGLQTQR